jgi:hypothetical protein
MARYEQTHGTRGVPVLRHQQRPGGEDWLCQGCGKLLGVIHGFDVHIRFERRHEYMAALPASATCRKCGTLNRARMIGPT